MHRICCALLLALVLPLPAWATPGRLTPEQALRDLRILERGLTDLHPGLYRYQGPEDLAAEFAAARAAVADGAEPTQLYLLAMHIAASVRCGHTWTNPLNQGATLSAALDGLPTLPVHLRVLQDRFLVTASADPKLLTGDEILSIDGRDAGTLVSEFLPYLRADGSNDGKRRSQLDSDQNGGTMDRLLPLLHPPMNGAYTLGVRGRDGSTRQVSAEALSSSLRDERLAALGAPRNDEAWRLRVDGDVAVLTLPTFSFWRSDFDWKGFLDDTFTTLEKRRIPKLVIDLRQNEGGDDGIGRALLGYLIARPYQVPAGRVESAYERVPYDLTRFLDTWDFSFFDRTGKVTRGPGRNWLLVEQPKPVVVAPQSRHYSGRVAALVGPRMSSAGFLIARELKATGAATLVGQATGGNLRGLNGGQLAWMTLPNSGVAVDIPLVASVHDGQPDSGVVPDVAVESSLEEIAAGRDPDREAAEAWLSKTQGASAVAPARAEIPLPGTRDLVSPKDAGTTASGRRKGR
ncbi:MAG: S41 family peptidase [Pseudoxanthomonas sp.]